VVGCSRDSTVTNCYYLTGCAADGSAVTQFGIGNSAAGSTTADLAGQTDAGTADQFAGGEVAYRLNGDQSTIVFKQTIGEDEHPNFAGMTVYGGYASCADDEMVYSNDSSLSAEKPGHTHGTPSYSWTEDPTTLTVTVSCTACGETLTGSTTDMKVTTSEDGLTTTYTATVTLDGKEYTDSKVVSNEVTSVNITWGSMNFTYTDESGWNNPDTAWVQVANTGDTALTVTYDYVTERADITGSFFDGTSTVTAPAVIDAEAAKKIWLRLDGSPGEALNNTKIGSVKLTIE